MRAGDTLTKYPFLYMLRHGVKRRPGGERWGMGTNAVTPTSVDPDAAFVGIE